MQQAFCGELIDKAAQRCGSRSKLAKELGVSPQRVNDWATGFRQMPPEQAAIVADIAGLVPEEWLARVTALNSKGKPYGVRLEKALSKCLRLTGAAVVSCLIALVLCAGDGHRGGGKVAFFGR
jgi:plasmid maintenance system antidote protein VapI